MFSKVADFARRHPKKLIFGGLVAGGMYAAHRYQSSFEENRQQIRKKIVDEMKRAEHFDAILKTSDQSVLNLLETLRRKLNAELGVEEILEEVRAKPENRIFLWDEIKIRVLTYGVASVYTESLLICALRTMMGIIGGYMLANSRRKSNQANEVHSAYLNMLQNFLDKGVHEVIRVVKIHVLAAFGPIELKQVVTADDFLLGFNFVRTNVKIIENAPAYLMMDHWTPACTSQENPLSNSEILNQLTSETRDILQCHDCQAVLERLIGSGFRGLNAIATKAFGYVGDGKCHLITLLPSLKTEIYKRDNGFVKESLNSSCSKDFSANVYEAFCNNPRD
ncbi:peroxisomal biogenesis factor 3-like [Galendromus occidentalis]|uniref:Peroxisomal biogenesis factor 3 n=1 Tax=Galendromus occidentalis TaxID=34638 RepID=A0AAJ6QXH0_9ACAR|nr:peroxisomal biogenesis factor 3-like [Galendromus occidentalis]